MRTLLLTVLDLEREPHQRTHHVADLLEEISDELVVMYKTRATDRSPAGMLRDAFRFSARETGPPGCRQIALHPPLNCAQAIAVGLVEGAADRSASPGRRALAASLSLLGSLRDPVSIAAFVGTLLVETRGFFDLCVVDGPFTAAAGLALRRIGRVGAVLYDDMDYVAGGQMLRFRRAYTEWLERATIRRADEVLCAGYRLGAHREAATGRRVRVVPNGVDPARFRVAARARCRPHRLVYVGNVAPFAGVEMAVRAVPLVRSVIPEVRLRIVGDGEPPYMRRLERVAARLGVDDAVELAGPVPYAEVPGVLADADIGIATFRPDPLGAFAFPLKVLEYMAAGLPVVCTADTESEEILRRFPGGIAAPFDAEDIARATMTLIEAPERYSAARTAAKRAARHFTWERTGASIREAITALGSGLPRDRGGARG